MTEQPQPQQRRRSRLGAFVLMAIFAVVIIVIITSLSSGGPSTTYRASVTGQAVINPADLAVTVRVTNTGKAAGTPACTINAADPSSAYTGIDIATLKGSVAPGATTNFVDNLTITGQGAQYVTDVTVSCK